MPDYIAIGPASAAPHVRLRSHNATSLPPGDWLQVDDQFAAADAIPARWLVVEAEGVREATTSERNAQVDAYRAERLAALRHEVNAYGQARGYDTATELRLKDLHARAVADGLTNRATLIASVLTWQASLLGHYMTKVAALEAATTVAGCDAVTWDFDQFTASDPAVTVTDALKVGD